MFESVLRFHSVLIICYRSTNVCNINTTKDCLRARTCSLAYSTFYVFIFFLSITFLFLALANQLDSFTGGNSWYTKSNVSLGICTCTCHSGSRTMVQWLMPSLHSKKFRGYFPAFLCACGMFSHAWVSFLWVLKFKNCSYVSECEKCLSVSMWSSDGLVTCAEYTIHASCTMTAENGHTLPCDPGKSRLRKLIDGVTVATNFVSWILIMFKIIVQQILSKIITSFSNLSQSNINFVAVVLNLSQKH